MAPVNLSFEDVVRFMSDGFAVQFPSSYHVQTPWQVSHRGCAADDSVSFEVFFSVSSILFSALILINFPDVVSLGFNFAGRSVTNKPKIGL